MPIFSGQTLQFRPDTRDVVFGTNVRSLLSTAGADTNFTITFTGTTAVTQTVNPYTNISDVTDDNRTDLGWAMNQKQASVDSMGAILAPNRPIPARKRYIPAGNWSFQFSWSGSAPAPFRSYPVTVIYSVYRVAANGGTRTLLFTASADTQTVSLVAGSGTGSATSTQPAYIFEPKETLHIAVQITSSASVGPAGAKYDTVITCRRGDAGTAFVTLPTPGLRSVYFDESTASTSVVPTRSIFIMKDRISSVASIVGNENILVRKTISSVSSADGRISKLFNAFRKFNSVGNLLSTRNLLLAIKDKMTATLSGIGSIRRLQLKKSFQSVANNAAVTQKLILKDLINSTANTNAAFEKRVIFLRDFQSITNTNSSLNRVAIIVRDFKSTASIVIRPRIALDWDDLPDSGGGTINVYRPLILFDD